MLAECKHCGAPLQVPDAARFVRCSYCDHTNRVRTMRTLAMERPEGWTPPSQWTPPEHVPAPSVPHAFHQVRLFTTKLVSLIMTMVALVIVAGAGIFVLLVTREAQVNVPDLSGIQLPSVNVPPPWDGSEPLVCGGNRVLRVENVQADVGNRTAVEVTGNCQLTIVGSTLRGWEGAFVTGNGRLQLENTKIEAKGAGIRAEANGQVEAVDCFVVADGSAVQATSNAHITLAGGRYEGTPTALQVRQRNLELRGAEIIDSALGHGDLSVSGDLTTDEVRQALEARSTTLRRCYESALRRHPELRGQANVSFEVSPTGRVSSAPNIALPSDHAQVQRCLGRAFRRVRFPAPEDGQPVAVQYRLTI